MPNAGYYVLSLEKPAWLVLFLQLDASTRICYGLCMDVSPKPHMDMAEAGISEAAESTACDWFIV